MHPKDYYELLGVEPSATLAEIKKKYRRLALQYHPDKNQDNPYAAALFTEIKEAYEVLTNPAKKEYYLQLRWYDQSISKRKKQGVINPVAVLMQSLELEKYVSTLDVFRMDKEGLQQYILGLISNATIEQLKKFEEPETISQIITTILKATHSLPKAYLKSITDQLLKLSEGEKVTTDMIEAFTQKADKKHLWKKYSLIIIIIATVFLCLLIYLAGR